jgi:glycosyltransferase involved in cell wall biosynthesis
MAGVTKRIYTRHHATFHQVYFPRAVWYDKFISAIATDVVAISENVKCTLLNEGINVKKIQLIHHGFKLKEFEQVSQSNIQLLKQKYNPLGRQPVIGVISRYFELKGIQYIIPAFSKLLERCPDALLVLANANGNYASQIKLLLQSIPKNNYLEVSFEPDISALYHLFDIFIHVPISPSIEAFGQTYVESLAAGIPSIFTLSGVAPEFIQHKHNAYVVDFKDSQSIYHAMDELVHNTQLSQQMVAQGKKDVQVLFELATMIHKLEQLYLK